MDADRIFCQIGKNLWGNFSNLKLNTRLPRKNTLKFDVNVFCEERKIFNVQIHLIIVSRDLRGPTSTNMNCVHLLTHASKISVQRFEHTTQILPGKPPYLLTHEIIFFVERPNYWLATSSLSVEQNLVHFDRFIHFSQKVVGATLRDTITSLSSFTTELRWKKLCPL